MDPPPLSCSALQRREGWPRAATLRSTARGIWKVFCRLVMAQRQDLRTSRLAGIPHEEEICIRMLHGDHSLELRTKHGLYGCARFYSHKGAIARPEQELRIDQRNKQIRARGRVQPPETTCLRLGEAQARHFEELSLHSSEHLVSCTGRLGYHFDTLLRELRGCRVELSNRCASEAGRCARRRVREPKKTLALSRAAVDATPLDGK